MGMLTFAGLVLLMLSALPVALATKQLTCRPNTGLLCDRKGTVSVQQGALTALLDIKSEQDLYSWNKQLLQDNFRILLKLLNNFEIVNRISTALRSRIRLLELEVHSLPDNLGQHYTATSSNRTKTNARVKRGLINLGGNVLNVVFGTATEQQVDDLRLHIEKEQMKAKISNKILQVKVHTLTKSLQQVSDILTETEVFLRDNQNEMQMIENVQILESKTNFLAEEVQFLMLVAQNFQETVRVLENGKLPFKLINENFKKLISEGTEFFPKLVFPSDPSKSTPYDLQMIIEVRRAYEGFFLLELPFISRNTYELYELEKFPREASEGRLAVPGRLPKFLAASNITFFELKNNEKLREISKFEDSKFIFKNNVAIHGFQYPSCALELMINGSGSCTWEEFPLNKKFYAKFFGNSWYVWFANRTKITIICPLKEIFEEVAGFIKVSYPCTLTSKYGNLVTLVKTRASNIVVGGGMEKSLEKFEMGKNFHLVNTSKSHLEKLNKKIGVLNETAHSNINKVKIDADFNWRFHQFHMSTTVSVIIAILIISVIGCCVVRKRLRFQTAALEIVAESVRGKH